MDNYEGSLTHVLKHHFTNINVDYLLPLHLIVQIIPEITKIFIEVMTFTYPAQTDSLDYTHRHNQKENSCFTCFMNKQHYTTATSGTSIRDDSFRTRGPRDLIGTAAYSLMWSELLNDHCTLKPPVLLFTIMFLVPYPSVLPRK